MQARAHEWQREGRPSAGLFLAIHSTAPSANTSTNLELIAKATEPDEWIGRVEKLPLG